MNRESHFVKVQTQLTWSQYQTLVKKTGSKPVGVWLREYLIQSGAIPMEGTGQ